jgi:AcrR family transcriptional regulator
MTEKLTAELISDAALELLEREGHEVVSMRRIAAIVGVTPMAIYHHFHNREALLNSVTDREFAKFAYTFSQPADRRQTGGSTQTQLVRMMEAYIDYAYERPRIFDYIFAEPRPGARTFPEDFCARRSPSLNAVADVVAAEMKAGTLRKDDVWEVALELWAHTHGYIALMRAGRIALPEAEFRKLVRRSLRRLIRGLEA